MDLLFQAATSWDALTQTIYRLIYGKKKNLISVDIVFRDDDFFHMAGFQYLKDIRLSVQFPKKKAIHLILASEIKETDINKSANFLELIKPRLEAIIQLERMLDNNFTSYVFNTNSLPFHTKINADFLLSGNEKSDLVFLFTKKEIENGQYVCSSGFTFGERDFRKNQKSIVLLKKEKVQLLTGELNVLYISNTYQEFEKSNAEGTHENV